MSTRRGMRIAAVAVVTVVTAAGFIATVSAVSQDDAMNHAVARAQPLSMAAQEIYRDLSDADATAAALFLSGSQAGITGQQRYDADIRRVSAGLAAVTADAGDSAALRSATGAITADLPVYAKLVGTAQADNRQNLPVGAAYLREASTLLRASLLPAARQAYDVEAGRLASDDRAGAGDPGPEFAVVAVGIAVIALVQAFLFRRTNRLINIGVAVATFGMLALVIWLFAAAPDARHDMSSARGHRQSADALVGTELTMLRLHGDELLGLAARGEDIGGYERDFNAATATVTRQFASVRGARIADAELVYRGWLTQHTALARLESEPQQDNSANSQALAAVTGSEPGSPGAAFARIDDDLRRLVADEEAGYLAAQAAGRLALGGLAVGAAVLAGLALAAGSAGVSQRLRDYR